MKLIIDISENALILLKESGVDWLDAECILSAVAEGVPFPERKKGEWVLKQRGKFVDMTCSKCGYVRIKDYAYNYAVEEIEKEFNEDNAKPIFCECCGADMRPGPYKAESEKGKSCNTCKNNDDEFSGECYECVKNIQNHYEAESEE